MSPTRNPKGKVTEMYAPCFVRGCPGESKAYLGKLGFCDVHLDRAAGVVERYDLAVNKLRGEMDTALRGLDDGAVLARNAGE